MIFLPVAHQTPGCLTTFLFGYYFPESCFALLKQLKKGKGGAALLSFSPRVHTLSLSKTIAVRREEGGCAAPSPPPTRFNAFRNTQLNAVDVPTGRAQ